MDTIPNYMAQMRRKFHRIPELAFCEFETQRLLKEELSALGIPFREIGTGLIADLDMGKSKRLAFRSDMDALPLEEKTGTEYASQTKGMMHACGHDGHMALLLGFARYCIENKERLDCNVRFIFQPAEEGEGGALKMIDGGALEGVVEIYALHLDPALEPGKLGLCYGASMAGDFEFDVIFSGEAAHCAERERGRDALIAACDFVSSLSEINGKGDSVLHAGKMSAGRARNIVADSAEVGCSLRYFDEKERQRILRLIKYSLSYLNDRYGVKGTVRESVLYIPLKNHRDCVDKLKAVSDFVIQPKRYLAEDFAYYLEKCKGAHGWLGVKKFPQTKLHASDFDFDETCLEAGLEIYRKLVEKD